MSRPARIILIVTVLLLVVVAGRIGYCESRRSRLETGFNSLVPGDSSTRVTEIMGEPGEIEACGDPKATDELNRDCRRSLYYYSFIERWIIHLDAEGRVIHKTHNVLY